MERLRELLSVWNIDISDHQLDQFAMYYKLLISWNEKINLTSITDPDEVLLKHFLDSLALLRYIDISGKRVIDVGSGAGFPGIPLKIMCTQCDITLLDSLNKRVSFLNEVISVLGLTSINVVHGRAEDVGHDPLFRESFDCSVSRAVANLSTLSEYCLPFVNLNGVFISYKSGNVFDEVEDAGNAVSILGGFLSDVKEFVLPGSDIGRSLIMINKTGNTPERYPRKAGMPSKKHL